MLLNCAFKNVIYNANTFLVQPKLNCYQTYNVQTYPLTASKEYIALTLKFCHHLHTLIFF